MRDSDPQRPYARPIDDRVTYVLDTSVLLADPAALFHFEHHDVVIPVVVLSELEAKRNHTELGWAARTTLRSLESLRQDHGSLLEPMPINPQGGRLRVELNNVAAGVLPDSLHGSGNDFRILAVAANLAREGIRVVLITKDLPLRLRASLAGLEAQEYAHEQVADATWTGFVQLGATSADIDQLYDQGVLGHEQAARLPCHTGIALANGSQSALARVQPDGKLRLVSERELFGVRGRSAEQRLALDLLADTAIGIVSLGGAAGTGKSVLALAAALDAVLERRSHNRCVVFRPLYAVGGQDLGYLPGTEAEKMNPWAAAVVDALEAIVSRDVIDEVTQRDLLEVLPLTHIRGRSLTEAFVIIDEAQNLERGVLLTALSRLGNNSRVVLTHDIAQRDNLRVGRHDGVVSVIDKLKGHPLFAHVTLTRSERSPVAELVTSLLDDQT